MITVRAAGPEHFGWIADKARLFVTAGFHALEAVDGERILGMVAYDGWTPNSCAMHVAIEEPIAVRRLLKPAFGIPFNAFDKGVVLASVLSTNKKSLKFTKHLGFRKVARLRDAYAKGVHLVVFEMRREDCRWLKGQR